MIFEPLAYESRKIDPDMSHHRSEFSGIEESWIYSGIQGKKYNFRASRFDGPIVRSVIEPGLFRKSKFNDKILDIELNGSELVGSKFIGSIEHSELEYCDSRGIVANGISMRNNSFYKSNLFKAKLNGSDLSGSDLSRTNLEMAELRHSNISNVNFESATNLTNAIFYKTILDQDTYEFIWKKFQKRGLLLNTKSQDYFKII